MERITTALELAALLALVAALGVAIHDRHGLVWALVAVGVGLLVSSLLVQVANAFGRREDRT